MKKLDEVIAGLECCGTDAVPDRCPSCPYEHSIDLTCVADLMDDALGYLRRMDDLRKDMWDLANKNHELVRKLKLVTAQRNSAWEKLARITGEREAAWLDEAFELRTCYCPVCDKHFEVRSNDSSGVCPDCGHHVVLRKVEVEE